MMPNRIARPSVRALAAIAFIVLLGVLTLSFAHPAAADTGSVSIQGFAFGPPMLTVPAGTTVTWTNNDTTAHSATADDNSWDTDTIAPGASAGITFMTPGMYTYHCKYHPFMKGVVVVTDTDAIAPGAPDNSSGAPATATPGA